MRFPLWAVTFLLTALSANPCRQARVDVVQVDPGLEQKVASVLPRPEEERWLQIPWRTNIMKARGESQQTGKPLFVWIMDGNPLGCT